MIWGTRRRLTEVPGWQFGQGKRLEKKKKTGKRRRELTGNELTGVHGPKEGA